MFEGWGRFKPWWANKKGKKFVKDLGDSNLLKLFDFLEPGAGTGLDAGFDLLGGVGGDNNLPKPRVMYTDDIVNQQIVMYGGGALLLYFMFLK